MRLSVPVKIRISVFSLKSSNPIPGNLLLTRRSYFRPAMARIVKISTAQVSVRFMCAQRATCLRVLIPECSGSANRVKIPTISGVTAVHPTQAVAGSTVVPVVVEIRKMWQDRNGNTFFRSLIKTEEILQYTIKYYDRCSTRTRYYDHGRQVVLCVNVRTRTACLVQTVLSTPPTSLLHRL